MTISARTTLKTMLFGIGLIAAACAPALAQKGLDEPFQGAFKEALAGKTVAYVPVAMNFDLTEGWFAGLKRELEPYGMKVIVRDPELEHQRRRAGGDDADLGKAGGDDRP